jgi:hypothetical protein
MILRLVKQRQGSVEDDEPSCSVSLAGKLKPEGTMSAVDVSAVGDNVKAIMGSQLSTTTQLVHEDV